MNRTAGKRALTKPSSGGRRRAARRPAGSGRVRALLGLGTVAFLALGFGAQGTFAFWTDQATIQSGTFASGTLDITLNGALAGPGNNPGTTTLSALALANMVPGESVAAAFPVANAGTVGLTYTVSGTASGDLAPAMRFRVYQGAASNTTTAGVRSGTCSGTPFTGASQTYSATASAVVTTADARALAPTVAESICVVAQFDIASGNGFQGKSMTASLIFDAKQVGAP